MAHTFTAQRWTRGNLLFPVTITVGEHELSWHKRKLIGGEHITVSLRQIASVVVETFWFSADILIESSGGHQLAANGLRKSDAEAIKRLIDAARARM